MITRRRFLAGAGGAVALAAVGGAGAAVSTSRGRRLLHGIGLYGADDHDAPSVSTPEVAYDTFRSRHMGRAVRFGVASVDAPAATVVCLHGKGADERFAFSSIGLHRFVADAGLRLTVAAVDGGSGSYWHGPRRDGTDAGRMLIEEFVPRFEPTGPAGGIRPGFHDTAFWRSLVPEQLTTISTWLR